MPRKLISFIIQRLMEEIMRIIKVSRFWKILL